MTCKCVETCRCFLTIGVFWDVAACRLAAICQSTWLESRKNWMSNNTAVSAAKLKLINAFTKDGPWTVFRATLFILLLTFILCSFRTVRLVPSNLQAVFSRVLPSSHVSTEVLHAVFNSRRCCGFRFTMSFDLIKGHTFYNSCLKISAAFIFSCVQNIKA